MSNTIYDDKIWPRILKKYPKVKELAIQLGIENNPNRAREIRSEFRHNFGFEVLSDAEESLAIHLSSVEFVERDFLDGVVVKGSFANKAGFKEDAMSALSLILDDFNWTFNDFLSLCKERNVDIKDISFDKAYEIFLEVIQLKLKHKVPYTKLFVRKLLELSGAKQQDAIEIKNYFLENDPTMLQAVSQELLIDSSDNQTN